MNKKRLASLFVLPPFSLSERIIWITASSLIVLSRLIFGGGDPLTLAASLIGVTFLILNAKGHPLGQLLTVVFSILYGVISRRQAYYGEMITYLGMTAPMAVYALSEWIRHPAEEGSSVKIKRLGTGEKIILIFSTAGTTLLFFFILRALGTARLPLSTLSVATSFLAVFLTARRSAFFPLAYAMNDAVLVALWMLAVPHDPSAASAVVCFAAFLAGDLYGFARWIGRRKRQEGAEKAETLR